MMSSRKEKMTTAAFVLIVLIMALILITVGSFLPKWASVRNSTAEGNVSYSLWTREECFGIICTTDHVKVQWTNEDCWHDKHTGREVCKKTQGYKMRSDTTCRVANFCNSTWIGEEGKVRSLPISPFSTAQKSTVIEYRNDYIGSYQHPDSTP
ncbi:uncharacterized protein LOC143289052 isoform X2 [Babylonia areolata]|uniref:uncharacterized protein LOC143289052 isoform X2 n=1 Tax=Babylonia areolata TaxID=304850 RepID=UPI003FD0B1F3